MSNIPPVGGSGQGSSLDAQLEALLGYVPQNVITDVLQGQQVIDPETGQPVQGTLHGTSFIELIAAIQNAEQNFKDEIRRGDALFPLLLKAFHQAQAEVAILLIALLQQLNTDLGQWQDTVKPHNQKITNLNDASSDYESGVAGGMDQDNTEIALMSNAIDAYNQKLKDYQDAVLAQSLAQDDVDSAQTAVTLAKAAYDQAVADGADQSTLDQLQSTWDNAQSQLDAFNLILDAKKTATTDAQTALDAAIPVYEAAADRYNSYIDTRNAELNALQDAYDVAKNSYNTDLPDLIKDMQKVNQERAKLGLPALFYPQTMALPIITPNYPSVLSTPSDGILVEDIIVPTFDAIPSTEQLITSPNSSEIIGTYLAMQSVFNNQTNASSSKIDSLEKLLDIEKNLRGQDITLPNAIWQRIPTEFLSDQGGSGSDAGVQSMIVGLSSKNLLRTLTLSQAVAEATQQKIPLNPEVLEQLKTYLISLFQTTSLQGAPESAKFLLPQLTTLNPHGKESEATLNLKLLENVANLAKSGVIAEGVKNILTNAGLSSEQIFAIFGPVTNAITLGLIFLSLARLGVTLELPNLVTDSVAASTKGSTQDAIDETYASQPTSPSPSAQAASKVSISDIIENLFAQLSLKMGLKDQLQDEFHQSNEEAIKLANAIINSVASSHPESVGQLRSQLNAILNGHGFDPLETNKLASSIIERTLGEFGNSSTLLTTFNPNINKTDLGSILINAAAQLGVTNQKLIKSSVEVAANNKNIATVGEFRKALVAHLKSSGLTSTQANFLGNQAVNFIKGGEKSVTPPSGAQPDLIAKLKSSLSPTLGEGNVDKLFNLVLSNGPYSSEQAFLVSLKEAASQQLGTNAVTSVESAIAQSKTSEVASAASISDQITTKVMGLLSNKLGAAKAQSIADQLSTVVTGGKSGSDLIKEGTLNPNSILSLMNNQVEALKINSDNVKYNEWLENLHSISQYNSDLSTLMSQVFAAPTALISSAVDGLSHGKRSIDIPEIRVSA